MIICLSFLLFFSLRFFCYSLCMKEYGKRKIDIQSWYITRPSFCRSAELTGSKFALLVVYLCQISLCRLSPCTYLLKQENTPTAFNINVFRYIITNISIFLEDEFTDYSSSWTWSYWSTMGFSSSRLKYHLFFLFHLTPMFFFCYT
jgi:hypothetical protein